MANSDDEDKNKPVHLVEDPATGDRFIVYGTDKGLKLDIRYEGETLWMTQAQIGELFGRDVSTISRHIANVFEDGELEEATSLQKVQTTGGRPAILYSLDMVISVGYRASSAQATLFRKWATQKLVQFATKGFVVDADRLKRTENADRVAELREIIRDIRSDEANVYRELRRICSMCQDYDGSSEVWREFYQNTQAKLLFAVTSHTPAEIIDARADAKVPNMGLTTWPHDNIRKQDATISKNYLADGEIKELNRLTTILLDIFEDQLDLGRLVVMNDVRSLLDQQLKSLNRSVLSHGGRVKMTDAKKHAEREYEAFNAARKLARNTEADDTIDALRKTDKSLPSRSKPRQ
ncbi:MAG: RhuM family protein [Devosia sp.]